MEPPIVPNESTSSTFSPSVASVHPKSTGNGLLGTDDDHLDSYRKEIELSRARKLQLANRGPVGKKIVELAAHEGPVDIVELHNQYPTVIPPNKRQFTEEYTEYEDDQNALLQAAATISSPVQVSMMGMGMSTSALNQSNNNQLVPIPLEMEIVNTNIPPKQQSTTDESETVTTTTNTTTIITTSTALNGPDPELLQNEINQLRIEMNELKDKLRQEIENKLSLQGYLDREKIKNQALKDRLTATEERCSLAENRVASLEAIVQGERNRSTDEHSAYESLQRRFEAAEITIQEYKKAVQHAEAEREHETNRANGFEKRLQTLLDNVKDLEALVRRETEAKHAGEIQIKGLQDELHRLEQKLRQETDQRISTETKLRNEMEARTKAEARIQAEIEARNRIEAEARARAEADALARAAAERAASETAKTVTELAYEEALAKLRSELLLKERELVRAHEIAHETNQQLIVTRDLLDKTRKLAEEERLKFQQSTTDHEKERTKLNQMHEQERLRMIAEIEKLANKVTTTESALEIMRKERNNALNTIEKEKQRYTQLTKDTQQVDKVLKDKIHELENEVTSLQEELGMAKRRVVQLQQQQQPATEGISKLHSIRKPARTKEVISITLESVALKKAQEAALEKEKRERIILYPSLHTHTTDKHPSGSSTSEDNGSTSVPSASVAPAWDNKPDLPSPPLTHVTIQEYHNEIANHRRIVADYEQKLERQIANANENKEIARKYREEVLILRTEIDTTTEELLRMESIAVNAGERLSEITNAYNSNQTIVQQLRNHINDLEGGSCVHGLTFPGIPETVVSKNHVVTTTTTNTVIQPKDNHQRSIPHRSYSATSPTERQFLATEGTNRSLSPVRVATETIVQPEISYETDFSHFMNSISSASSASSPMKSSFVIGPLTNTSTNHSSSPSPRGRTQQRNSKNISSKLTSPKKYPVAFGSSSPRPGPNGKVESPISSTGLANIELASSLRSSSVSFTRQYSGTTEYPGKRHTSPEKSLIANVIHAGASNLLVPLPPAPVVQFTDTHNARDYSHPHSQPTRSPSSSIHPRTHDLSPQAKAIISIASGIPSANNHYNDSSIPYHRSNSPMLKQLQELSAKTVLSSIAEVQAQDKKLREENSQLKDELALQLLSNKQQRKDAELRAFSETSSILAGNPVPKISPEASIMHQSSPGNNDLRSLPDMTITPSSSPIPNNYDNNFTTTTTTSNNNTSFPGIRSPTLRNTIDVYSKTLSIPSFSSTVNADEETGETMNVTENNSSTEKELARLFQDVLQNTGTSSVVDPIPLTPLQQYPQLRSSVSFQHPSTVGVRTETNKRPSDGKMLKSSGTGISSRSMYPGGVGTVIALASGHKSSTTSPTIVKGNYGAGGSSTKSSHRKTGTNNGTSKPTTYSYRHSMNHVQPPSVPVDTSLISPLLDQGIGKEFVKAFHPSMGGTRNYSTQRNTKPSLTRVSNVKNRTESSPNPHPHELYPHSAVMLQDDQQTLVPTTSMSNTSSSTLLAAPDGYRPLVLVRPLSVNKRLGFYSTISAASSNSQTTIGSQPVGIPLKMI